MERESAAPKVRDVGIMSVLIHVFVWFQIAAALLGVVWHPIHMNERPFLHWALPFIVALPYVVGLVTKRRIRKAESAQVISKEAAILCADWINNILFAAYLCFAILDIH